MIFKVRGCVGLVMSAMLVSAAVGVAQGPGGPGFGPGFGGFGRGPGFGGGGKVVTGEPFTASITRTSVDKLGDGTKITHSSTSTEARDAQGRTYTQTTTTEGSGTFTRTTVFDPVAKTITSWGSQSKIATVVTLPSWTGGGGRGDRPAPPAGAGGPEGKGPGGNGRPHPQVTTEQLGTKTLDGVTATGVKTTMTVPAGAEGNDKPLVSWREVWTAPDLKLVLLETSDNPRAGFSKVEVTSLTIGDPDSTLFQVPSGYTVKTEGRHRGM